MVAALRRITMRLRPHIPTLLLVLPPYVAGKAISFIVPYLQVFATSKTPGHPTGGEFIAPFGNWDGVHYQAIVEHGYPSGPLDLIPGSYAEHPGHLWAFFPGFPLLVRGVSFVVRDVLVSGIVLNSIAELIALYFLVRLITAERDLESARFSAWLLALYPMAIFLSAFYTESTFLAFTLASLYYMRQGRHTTACVLAGGAIAVRITGIVLIPALIVEYLSRRRWRPGGDLIDVGFAVLPLVLFIVYAHQQTGDGLAYQHAQQSASFGGRSFAFPWSAARSTFYLATSSQSSGYNFLFLSDFVVNTMAFFVVVLLWVSRRIPRSLATYGTGLWLLSACLTYWAGTPRYLMAMVPAAMLLADATARRPQVRWTILAISAGLLAFDAIGMESGRLVG